MVPEHSSPEVPKGLRPVGPRGKPRSSKSIGVRGSEPSSPRLVIPEFPYLRARPGGPRDPESCGPQGPGPCDPKGPEPGGSRLIPEVLNPVVPSW